MEDLADGGNAIVLQTRRISGLVTPTSHPPDHRKGDHSERDTEEKEKQLSQGSQSRLSVKALSQGSQSRLKYSDLLGALVCHGCGTCCRCLWVQVGSTWVSNLALWGDLVDQGLAGGDVQACDLVVRDIV